MTRVAAAANLALVPRATRIIRYFMVADCTAWREDHERRMALRQEFALEALEPRVLLSGTVAVTPVVAPTGLDIQVEEAPISAPQSSQDTISYDPASQIDSILGEAATPQSEPAGSSSGETPATAATGNQPESQSSSSNNFQVLESNAPAVTGSQAETSNVATAQSVETLTAANAPPIAAAPPVVGVVTAQAHQFQITFDYSQDTHNFFQDPIRRKLWVSWL